jgi:hypothetical protein
MADGMWPWREGIVKSYTPHRARTAGEWRDQTRKKESTYKQNRSKEIILIEHRNQGYSRCGSISIDTFTNLNKCPCGDPFGKPSPFGMTQMRAERIHDA